MWTPDALGPEARPWSGTVWRVVESQAHVSTMKLVDTLGEQDLLERILERAKPVIPPEAAHLHWLLASPFRYRPYPHGSRFRRALQPEGCFYAAASVETAIAEQAFYRYLFFLEAPTVTPPQSALEHTAFAVRTMTERGIDLTSPPFDRDGAVWTHPTAYEPCQDLADAARQGGIDVIHYRSARDPRGGMNIAVLAPGALRSAEPETPRTWHLFIRPRTVQAFCEMPRLAMEFTAAGWANDPRIAEDGGRDRD